VAFTLPEIILEALCGDLHGNLLSRYPTPAGWSSVVDQLMQSSHDAQNPL
jgi:hypothetical protein